jgi:Flp pilus assembly protein TadD
LVELGRGLTGADKFDQAIDIFRRAEALQPQNTAIPLELINALLKANRFGDAEAEARALASAHGDSTAHNLLGVALASQGRLREATREFEDAVRLDPSSREARENLAHVQGLQPARRSTGPS